MRILLIVALFVATLTASTLAVGDEYPRFELKDQFGGSSKIYPSDKFIIMSFEKSVALPLNKILKTKHITYLDDKNIRYVADISGMPSLIASWFALPKMREYKYIISLIDDDNVATMFVKKEGMVTIFTLNNHKITSIEFMPPTDSIAKFDNL